MIADEGLFPGLENVSVNLGRRYVGMSKHLLDRPQIGPVGQEMAGKSVPQRVGRYGGAVDPGVNRQFLEDLGKPVTGQMTQFAPRKK